VDAPGGEFVPQGLGEQIPNLGLAFRPAHIERHRRHDMARLFVLQEDVTDLGTIPVRQDHIVAFFQKVGEERAGRLDPTPLGRRIAGARR
jgi:hypothetical protein